MAEENKKPQHNEEHKLEEKMEEKKNIVNPVAEKMPEKENNKSEVKHQHQNHDKPVVDTKSSGKKEQASKARVKKTEAVAHALGLHASKKHCMYICNFIRGRTIDSAIAKLEQVAKLKRAIPFKGEIPHRKGMHPSGRYPVSASLLLIKTLKALKGNVLANGMDLDKTRIAVASANWASRPARAENTRAKRTNVLLIARELGSHEARAEKAQEKK
jgi:ribosomal protein L22